MEGTYHRNPPFESNVKVVFGAIISLEHPLVVQPGPIHARIVCELLDGRGERASRECIVVRRPGGSWWGRCLWRWTCRVGHICLLELSVLEDRTSPGFNRKGIFVADPAWISACLA